MDDPPLVVVATPEGMYRQLGMLVLPPCPAVKSIARVLPQVEYVRTPEAEVTGKKLALFEPRNVGLRGRQGALLPVSTVTQLVCVHATSIAPCVVNGGGVFFLSTVRWWRGGCPWGR